MQGILRVLPAPGKDRRQRLVLLRQAPSTPQLEDIIGGKLTLIDGFDTTLHDGETVPCLAFRARDMNELRPNAYADILWLQALLRKSGYAGVRPLADGFISGTVAILSGDKEFLRELVHNLLEIPGTRE